MGCCVDENSRQAHVNSNSFSFASRQTEKEYETESIIFRKLEQVHDNLLGLARLLERANVTPRPQIAKDWVDGQEVMNALHISQRTLQNLRDNGTLGYTTLGKKYFYRIREIDDLLQNNYVMYKLSALGKQEKSLTADNEKGGGR